MQATQQKTIFDCPACGTSNWNYLFHRQNFDFVICTTCQLTRLEPQPTESQLYEHYSTRAEAGNYELSKACERTPTLKGVFDYLAAAAQKPGKVFDAGCFDGGFLDIALASGWETSGLELQGKACDAAKAKHPGRVFEGTLESFTNYAHNSFDAVTAIGVIEHLREPLRLVKFANTALKSGGLLVIQTPNYGSVPRKLMGPLWPCFAAPEHTFYFNLENLKKLCEKENFILVCSKSHWKPLRLGYAFDQFKNFGPEIYNITGALSKILPDSFLNSTLDLYGGEMLTIFKKV